MGLHRSELPGTVQRIVREGAVIPAHPLALDANRRLDMRRQRALSRYYIDAGAGGLAVGVHTTQFAIREVGLYEPVLRFAAIDNVIAIKVAPFNRYRTLDVVRGVVAAGAEDRVTLYTGNDDHIVLDLVVPFDVPRDGGLCRVRFKGGLPRGAAPPGPARRHLVPGRRRRLEPGPEAGHRPRARRACRSRGRRLRR